jgi:Rps23 Pro-64 3,4-dihydroxylase Tpa1-like proline 4-hydroxylase
MSTNKFNGVPCVIFDDYYSDNELAQIAQEIEFLAPKLGDENTTGTAQEKTPFGEKSKKRGHGVFVDEVYQNRGYSSILTVSHKIFADPKYSNKIKEAETSKNGGIYWNLWKTVNHHSTLLQTYRNGDYYNFHRDSSLFTVITTLKFANEPMVGGDLLFRDNFGKEFLYKAEHNSTIVFPSVIEHSVTEVCVDSYRKTSIFDHRWSIAHLMFHKPA